MKLNGSLIIIFIGFIAAIVPAVIAGTYLPSHGSRLQSGKPQDHDSIKPTRDLSFRTAPKRNEKRNPTVVEIEGDTEIKPQKDTKQQSIPAEKRQVIRYRLECEGHMTELCKMKHGSDCDEYGNHIKGSRWCQTHCTCEPYGREEFPSVISPWPPGNGIPMGIDPWSVPGGWPRRMAKDGERVPVENQDSADKPADEESGKKPTQDVV